MVGLLLPQSELISSKKSRDAGNDVIMPQSSYKDYFVQERTDGDKRYVFTIFDVVTGDTPCKIFIYNYDKFVIMCKGYQTLDGGITPQVEE